MNVTNIRRLEAWHRQWESQHPNLITHESFAVHPGDDHAWRLYVPPDGRQGWRCERVGCWVVRPFVPGGSLPLAPETNS